MFLPTAVQSVSFGITYSASQAIWSHYICPELSKYISSNHCEGIKQLFSIFSGTAAAALSPLNDELFNFDEPDADFVN